MTDVTADYEHDHDHDPDHAHEHETESLEIEPDEEFEDVAFLDDAADATAAIHGGGGDADRAESLIEATGRMRHGEPVPDDERPV
jgi:hypothetical protein